jgi:hypothetical protein
MEGNQHRSRLSKFKIKNQKPVFKMVSDMLTEKWIFIRKDKQLEDSTLKSFHASIFEAFKKLSERAKAMRETIELTKKMKKKKS